jgi:hypothetical protein
MPSSHLSGSGVIGGTIVIGHLIELRSLFNVSRDRPTARRSHYLRGSYTLALWCNQLCKVIKIFICILAVHGKFLLLKEKYNIKYGEFMFMKSTQFKLSLQTNLGTA